MATQDGTDGTERRATARQIVNLPTHILVDGQRLPCHLVDLSSSGALVTLPAQISVGSTVAVGVPGNETVTGTVVRLTPTHFAIAFPNLIVLAALG
ncbi:MAG: PilZ domain-containing protein [Rhodospirillales bacterium]|nr:PilZ domain-containing protein [Rhodospirillales bacterium]